MQFKVTQKNTRQTPRKVRLVANAIKDLPLEQAIKQLAVMDRRATVVMLKTIKQAIANAKNNHGVDADKLAIKEILVNGGPVYKRFNAVSRGRAHSILKRTSHITVTLEEKIEKKAEKEVSKSKVEKKTEVKKASVKKTAAKETTKKAAPKKETKKTEKK
ncbi:MAG: 50S ribosomal protein L22 [Candidatus Pacebacteria bacterium]|nr:50S ribosomal protein L22 [Candidatus Paceibacterota bacterium]